MYEKRQLRMRADVYGARTIDSNPAMLLHEPRAPLDTLRRVVTTGIHIFGHSLCNAQMMCNRHRLHITQGCTQAYTRAHTEVQTHT